MTYIKYIEDAKGDLVELEYFCSVFCAPAELVEAGGSPTLGDSDCDIYCNKCEDLIQEAII